MIAVIKKINPKVFYLLVSLVLTGVIMKALGPAGKLDSRFYYTGQEAMLYLVNLTIVQRGFYLYGEILDFWFLINYSWLIYLGYKKFTSLPYLSVIPGIFDLLETSVILHHLLTGSFLISLSLLGIISCLKWSSGLAVLGYLAFKISSHYRK